MSNGIDLYISHNEVIADLLAENNVSILEEIIRAARSLLRANGRVVFTETYSNAPAVDHRIFENVDSFDQWVSELNEIRDRLDQVPLGFN